MKPIVSSLEEEESDGESFIKERMSEIKQEEEEEETIRWFMTWQGGSSLTGLHAASGTAEGRTAGRTDYIREMANVVLIKSS